MGDVQDTGGSKTMSDADVELGPVDYVVVAFPAGQAHFSGEMRGGRRDDRLDRRRRGPGLFRES